MDICESKECGMYDEGELDNCGMYTDINDCDKLTPLMKKQAPSSSLSSDGLARLDDKREIIRSVIESLEDAAAMKVIGLLNWDQIMLINAKKLKALMAG